MGWFSKKPELEEWKIKEEDFLVDSLDDYNDPHFKLILSDVLDMVPKALRNRVFLGGGFTSHLAGITTSHDDVDLFCTTDIAFNEMSALIKGSDEFTPQHGEDVVEVQSRGYGRILKFVHNNTKYDLVDSTALLNEHFNLEKVMYPPTVPDIIDLMNIFDLNWSMSAVHLGDNTLICHVEALSSKPRVNPERVNPEKIHTCLEGTIDRVVKYASRLKKTPDDNECKALDTILKYMLKEGIGKSKVWY
jgi:hypothetical protein